MVDEQLPPDSPHRGLSNVQLSEFVVQGLFRKYTHKVTLPTVGQDDLAPSIVILYGPNGVGKTTVLRMMDGLMRLDFDVFREVPFESCCLDFNTGQRLQVKSTRHGLSVAFEDSEVVLTSRYGTKGAADPTDSGRVEKFRKEFSRAIENISFQLIDSDRAHEARLEEVSLARLPGIVVREEVLLQEYIDRPARRVRRRSRKMTLAGQVGNFIRDAQIDSQAFFATGEPDLFSRIIEDLASPAKKTKSAREIRSILERVHQLDIRQGRFGIRGDEWDYLKVKGVLDRAKHDDRTLTVLSTFAEFLESRTEIRALLVERLLTFEHVMSEFFEDKAVHVDARNGLLIREDRVDETFLDESQLSSGEYQLLYLMVAALTTRRRGTVIAIDEPELSMHIAWQRKLVSNLVRCASRAAPLFVLATHSPDVASQFTDRMVELAPTRLA